MKKWIKGYEGLYRIHSDGIVESLPKTIVRKDKSVLKIDRHILNAYMNRGFLKISLTKNLKSHEYTLHTLMYKTFKKDVQGKGNIIHLDGDRSNNDISNLSFVPFKKKVIKKPKFKYNFTKSQIREMKSLHKKGMSQTDLSKKFKCNKTTINRYLNDYYN